MERIALFDGHKLYFGDIHWLHQQRHPTHAAQAGGHRKTEMAALQLNLW